MILGFLTIGAVLVLVGLPVVVIARLVARRLPASPVVEYLPPADWNLFEHALALRADRRVFTAAIIDLAVRRKVRVLTSGDGGRAVALQVVPGATLIPEEHSFLRGFRPRNLKPRQLRRYLEALAEIGIRVDDPANPPEVYFLRGKGVFRRHRRRHLTDFLDQTRLRMTSDGLTRRSANSVHLVLLSLWFLATLVVGLVLMLGAIVNGEWLGALVVLFDVGLVFWLLTLAPPPLLRFTEKGDELRRYLAGLRDYMELAEKDRLRVLQSPQGALRTPAGALTVGGEVLGLEAQPTAGDPVSQSALDRFVLTERLLPYAILFRQEREWQQELERLGGSLSVSQHMRVLGHTLEGTVAVLQAIAIIIEIIRVVGGVLSLFGRN